MLCRRIILQEHLGGTEVELCIDVNSYVLVGIGKVVYLLVSRNAARLSVVVVDVSVQLVYFPAYVARGDVEVGIHADVREVVA